MLKKSATWTNVFSSTWSRRGEGRRVAFTQGRRETIPYKFAGNHTLSYSRRSLSRDGRCFVHGAERLISITRFDWKGLYIRMTRRWLISVYAKLCRHVAADVRASLLVSSSTTSTWKSPWKVGGNDKSPRDREATFEANLSAASINKNLINAPRQGSRFRYEIMSKWKYTEIAISRMC